MNINEIPPDVETTNWNAVKLLASKYGIQLRPLEEVNASPALTPSSSNLSGLDGEGRPTEVEDLGVGTPFMITARRIEGGRVIYRFKWRGREGSGIETGKQVDSFDDDFEASSSETGYDPGSDSPSSSWGKKAGQRKQASSRTLKTKRSIPILQAMIGTAEGTASSSGNSESKSREKKRNFSNEADSARQSAQKVQRGDVLGAILGLRDGITAQDYSWIEGRRDERLTNERQKSPKAKGKDRHSDDTKPIRQSSAWRSISSFGEPVLQRNRTTPTMPVRNWDKSPIPRMIDFGQPFLEVDNVFQAPVPPAKDPLPDGMNGETIIFNVLQRYTLKGIERLDDAPSSPASSPTRTRQASSSSDVLNSPTGGEFQFNSAPSIKATPGDDPRFALWAIRSGDDLDTLVLSGRDGVMELGVPASPRTNDASSANVTPGTPTSATSAKRFSLRAATSNTSSSADSALSPGNLSSSQKSLNPLHAASDSTALLIAASTSCLIAELTSRIDNQLLTDFFYTYRAYLSSQELLRLLILRFQWAMAIAPAGSKDEARRKIVRVRTYVVIKYWLSNFFEIDFIPNRALRRQLTDWLNAPGSNEDVSIIKSLKKIVRGLKKGYEQAGVGGILMSDGSQSPEMSREEGPQGGEARMSNQTEASAVTLEWGDRSSNDNDMIEPPTRRLVGVSSITESWRSPISVTSSSPAPPTHSIPPPLPVSQNAVSRAFVNTVGKLSRFKRSLNSRGTLGGSGGDTNNFDGLEFEANDSGDLLFIRGGVENFIKFFNLNSTGGEDGKSQRSEEEPVSDGTTAQDGTPSMSTVSNQTSSTPASSIDFGSRERGYNSNKSGEEEEVEEAYGLGISSDDQDLHLIPGPHLTHANLAKTASADLLHHFQSDQTLRSLSTAQPLEESSLDQSPKRKSSHTHRTQASSSPRGPDNIVQLDDIDSSSDEDDGMVRRALRRLPGARDLRMANNMQDLAPAARTSMDSMSVNSFGRVYTASRRSISSFLGANRSSFDNVPWPAIAQAAPVQKIGTVQTEMLDPDEALFGYELVKGFRLDQLDSDDEEPGDVEAALRRLEGFIDQDKQKEKQRKVEAMWLRSQKQRDGEDDVEERAPSRQSAPSISHLHREATVENIETVPPLPSPSSFSPSKSIRKQKIQTAMPGSTSRRPVLASTSIEKGNSTAKVAPISPLSRLWAPPAPVHRSFLLNYRSEVIAQQFCLIESELFKAVTWQELVSDQWKSRHYPGQVLDWESFYQASVRRKADECKMGDSIGQGVHVEAIVARFNLTCNWVASEVVLTRQVDDRAAVICKLIRIAWKCYHHCNFATLTQIILGLQSPWVERLSKSWSRVGMLEMRMLRDLKAFINPARNFKHLRTAMKDMIVQGGMMDLITSSGPPRSVYKAKQSHLRLSDGCIPFFGLFLSDLAVNDTLPTLVEPSLPDSNIDYDPSTGHLCSLADPIAFAHLPPLPEEVHLSPLVNLYKYRNIAVTVKSVLAFQERLGSFQFEADANVYVKTLRIRCLEGEQLTQISQLVEP